MSNLRSDCRDLVKDLPVGNVMRTHVERLCDQIDYIEKSWHNAKQQIIAIRKGVEGVVCTEGEDKGVVLLSNESPTDYDPEQKVHIYKHEYFSPLGDALVVLHEKCQEDR